MGVAKNVNQFLLGICDPLGINDGHPLSSYFHISLDISKCETKHTNVFIIKRPFSKLRTKKTQNSLKSRV